MIAVDTGPAITPRNKEEERRLRNKEDERKNWMVVDPGELEGQDEADRAFGIRPLDFENSDQDRKKDYFFRTKSEIEGERTLAGRPGSSSLRSPSVRRPPPAVEERPGSAGTDEESNADGSGKSGGISFKPLLGSDPLAKSTTDKAPPLLRDFSAAKPPASRARDDQARRTTSTGPAFSGGAAEPRSPAFAPNTGGRPFGGFGGAATAPAAPATPRSGTFGGASASPGFNRSLPSASSGLAPLEPNSARKPAFSSGSGQSGFGAPPADNNRSRPRADYSLPSRNSR
jgi:hypothetical protein